MAVDTTSSNIVYIDLIDRGLKDYYTALKVDTYWDVKEDKGEFKKYCENNGLEVTKLLSIIDIHSTIHYIHHSLSIQLIKRNTTIFKQR